MHGQVLVPTPWAMGNHLMRRFLAGGLGLFFGSWISAANAQDAFPTAATAEPPSLVTLGRPIALTRAPSKPAPQEATTDRSVVPASYAEPSIGLPRPLVRGQI